MEDNKISLVQLRSGEFSPPNQYHFWSKAEINRLKELFKNGFGISDLAIEYGRTEIGIVNQLNLLGLFKPQQQLKPKRQKPQTNKCPCLRCKLKDCSHCEICNYNPV